MSEIRLSPVAAYDRVAADFGRLSENRRAYLSKIEQLVISEIPFESGSLLDVGAGDGLRAGRIAKAAGVKSLVMLEPSAEMRKTWPPEATGWALRAEDLAGKSDLFDVITCLWNVLGHVFPADSRIEVMRHFARLLSPQGRLFIDVNYRYNAWQYGTVRTALRVLRDVALPDERNGDVTVRWNVDGRNYATEGHVFTHMEFGRLADLASLAIEKAVTVNYSTGKISRSRFAGNPLYVLRRGRK